MLRGREGEGSVRRMRRANVESIVLETLPLVERRQEGRGELSGPV